MDRLQRRQVLVVAAAVAGGAAMAGAAPAAAAGRPRIPAGYAEVDPRTARRVPLTQSLRDGVPSYPGDPVFTAKVVTDSRTASHDDGGFLLEQVTSMGTHTASHISAPVHFILGAPTLAQLDEQFTLMPLAVVDVRSLTGDDLVDVDLLRRWERRWGRIPARGCVLLLTGLAELWDRGSGEDSLYVTKHAPGLSGKAVDWLFAERGILATGADSLGPDGASDPALQATTRTLLHGGITVENVGKGLKTMRPHGDWIGINGNRPALSGFQMGFTGYTLAR